MPSENRLSIVGIGPGKREWRTIAAEEAIRNADFVVGYKPYLELIADLLPGKKVFHSSMGKEVDRVRVAMDLLNEGSVALVSSGDPNVYGMAGLGMEMAPELARVEIVPGVTSFTAAACQAGLTFRECVAVISLSDLLTGWQEIESRLRLAAELEMPLALYNPRSKRRNWQLIHALDIFGEKDVLVAKNVGRLEEEIFWTTSGRLKEDVALQEMIDMTTLIIISGRGVFKGETCPEAKMNVVGIGPGNPKHLTVETESILMNSEKIYGATRYLDQIGKFFPGEKVIHTGPCSEKMAARFREASDNSKNGKRSTILTGGDPSIFSSGWRIMDQAKGLVPVHVSPGVSAFSVVAARTGAPLVNDFALLSDPKNPAMFSKLTAAGFGVAAYNVLGNEVSSLLQDVDRNRPVVLARDVSRNGEDMMIMNAEQLLDAKPDGSRFTLLAASANSYLKEDRIITRRGYQAKYSY